MDSCRHSCVKYFVLVFNLLFALAGLTVVGLGAYIQIGARHYLDFLNSTYLNIPIIFIVLGSVIFLVSFFACCGAMMEKQVMVYIYSFLMCVILLAQFGSSIAAFVLKVKRDLHFVFLKGLNSVSLISPTLSRLKCTMVWRITTRQAMRASRKPGIMCRR